MDILHDIHVHTNLSLCANEDAVVTTYIDACLEKGIRTIGFADHLWDKDVEGASDWYKLQDIEHVSKIRELVPNDTKGIRVLYGCETEFLGGTKVGITREHANLFDYILIPTSHIHMAGFVRPSNITSVKDIRELLLQRFKEAAILPFDVPVGLAHPFCPIAMKPIEQELLSGISDDEYRECFSIAAENNKSIEIQSCLLGSHLLKGEHGFSVEYVRMFSIALQEGCLFHIGSDSHSPSGYEFTTHEKLQELVRLLGLNKANFIEV